MNIPAVFLGPPAAGDVRLGDLLSGYEGGLRGRLGQSGGTVTTQAVGEGSGGGVTTLRYPHD